ncbi:MAG: NIPSNAP family protein [Rhodomicrobium sp.]
MIIDERTYTCLPDKLKSFLDIYESRGKPIQWPILNDPLAIFVTDAGTLNQVVFWWRFASMGDREARRATLAVAPGWTEYMANALQYLQRQENRILMPASLSPLKT